jgi:hypothetical protein
VSDTAQHFDGLLFLFLDVARQRLEHLATDAELSHRDAD